MDKTHIPIIALVLALALALTLTAGCVPNDTIPLKTVQIREYQGQELTSVSDLRENSIKGVQYINLTNYTLQITGLVKHPKEYTYEKVLDHQKYSKVITLHCVEGWDATILWEGVLVRDLLKDAGVQPQANTIIIHASDGYSTSFPLSYVMDNDILLAYNMNNATILPKRGFPFQLVAEDKWGYKWIKWVTKIELSDDESYEGYWEHRGYSNTGNLNESFYG